MLQHMVTILGHFELLADITDMYAQADAQYIKSGVHLVNLLGLSERSGSDDSTVEQRLQEKSTRLSDYSKAAGVGIRDIVHKVRYMPSSHFVLY